VGASLHRIYQRTRDGGASRDLTASPKWPRTAIGGPLHRREGCELKETACRFLESRKLCVCIKDLETQVLYQNDACLTLCGEMRSRKCAEGCMLWYSFNDDAPDREEGTQCYPNQVIECNYFDIIFINDGESLTTLLFPLDGKQQADARHMLEYDLTKREQEVVRLVITGHSNTAIAKELFISKATVKKHLNNIYKKIPADVFPR
jgi:DNA-binding CsgD family transcriptional regulator